MRKTNNFIYEYYAMESGAVFAGPYKRKYSAVQFCKKNLHTFRKVKGIWLVNQYGKKYPLYCESGWVAEVELSKKREFLRFDCVHINKKVKK
jgi:hypothetical protein